MNKFAIVGLLFVCAAVFGSVAFFTGQKTLNLMHNGVKTRATVVRLEEGSKHTRYPVVQFKTAAGEVIEDRGKVSSNPPAFKEGQEVEVFYKPDEPREWVINEWFDLWFLPSIFGFFSVGISIAAICVFAFMGRVRPPRDGVIFDSEAPKRKREL